LLFKIPQHISLHRNDIYADKTQENCCNGLAINATTIASIIAMDEK